MERAERFLKARALTDAGFISGAATAVQPRGQAEPQTRACERSAATSPGDQRKDADRAGHGARETLSGLGYGLPEYAPRRHVDNTARRNPRVVPCRTWLTHPRTMALIVAVEHCPWAWASTALRSRLAK